MSLAEATGYRHTDLAVGREATALARGLEIVADCVERPMPAAVAQRVVEAQLGMGHEPGPWHDVVQGAARVLSLQPQLREASARTLFSALGACPALGRSRDGQWLVVRGRRGRRLVVTVLDSYGERRRTLSPARLDRLAEPGAPWVCFEPLLALDPLARPAHGEPSRRAWSRLRSLVALERRDLGVVVIYALVIGGLTLATPIAVQAVVNTIAFGAVLQPLVVLTLLLLAGLGFSAVLRVLEAFVVEVIQRRVFVRVAEDFGRRLPAVEPHVHERHHLPELVNRFFDVVTVQKSAASLLLDGLSLALQTAIGLLLLSVYHPLLLAFGGVLVVLLAMVVIAGRGASRTALAESRAKYATAAWLEDVAAAPVLLGGAQAAQRAAHRTEMLCRDYLAARRLHFRVLLRQITGGLGLQVLAMVSLLGVGGYLVIDRQLTLGQLVAAELVIGAVAAGFAKLGKHLETAYDLAIAVDKLGVVVDLPAERRGGEAPESAGPASFLLRGVTLRRGERTLLRELALPVEAGQRLGVRARSGAGKSTLLDALAGLRPPHEGTVLLDGVDLRRLDLGRTRDRVVLLRDVELVRGSILDNLEIGAGLLSEIDARARLSQVGLIDAVDALPQGLDTPLLPSGAPLSSSQARRLGLARALAMRPRALLLDGSLDGLSLSEAEHEALLDALLGPEAPWTVVVVSEDPRVLARCDRVVRIEDGRLEEVR